jgi:outer membrane protein assembly factor BamB
MRPSFVDVVWSDHRDPQHQMPHILKVLLIALALAVTGAAVLAGPALPQNIHHRIIMVEYPNRILEISSKGRVVWEHTTPGLTVMVNILPNGNVSYAHGGKPAGAREIRRDHSVVWSYACNCPEVVGSSLLENGNLLIGQEGPPQAIELNSKGEPVRTVPLSTSYSDPHRQVRRLRQLPGGNILAALEGEGVVREFTPDGKVVWQYTNVPDAFDALRLKNGNTLISMGRQGRIIEVTPTGETVWEFGRKDAPQLNLTWITSLQLLPNGNVVVGNFLRGQEGKGSHAFEVSRDKKVVWSFSGHQTVKTSTAVVVLD